MIRCETVYGSLLEYHGPQDWWPASDAFEVIVGALLVQRTSWASVEDAIGLLRRHKLLSPEELYRAPLELIETCIRSVGFYRTKAARVRALAGFVMDEGGIAAFERVDTPALRRTLLGLEGVGPETADAILLYAFDRPAVVVDEYLRRLVKRLSAAATRDTDLRRWVSRDLAGDVGRLNELHALVVAHGRETCSRIPSCSECVLLTACRTGIAGGSDA